jgi:hypothetical protein
MRDQWAAGDADVREDMPDLRFYAEEEVAFKQNF